jgi:hypothetical protein
LEARANELARLDETTAGIFSDADSIHCRIGYDEIRKARPRENRVDEPGGCDDWVLPHEIKTRWRLAFAER